MIGFRVVNLLIPGDPLVVTVAGRHGDWTLTRAANFAAGQNAILTQHQNAETYDAEHPASMADGAAVADETAGEMLPLCLGAAYATGHSVTTRRSLPHSEAQFLQVGPRFPRERAATGTDPVVNDGNEFKAVLDAFLVGYRTVGQAEKVRLLVHHWLDSLSCWSLEDLYLSATTVLQTIAATEKRKAPIANKPSFYKYVRAAALRYGLPVLNHDFKDMRNDLIHDGTLSGTHFPNKTADDGRQVAVTVMNWIDGYIHAALGLGPVRKTRFGPHSLDGLNAYSV